MNYIIILLSVILAVLIFYLVYKNYFTSSSKLTDLTNLNLTNPTIPISASANGASQNVSYSLWVYVNSWSNTSTKSLVYRPADFQLYLDKDTPTLNLKTSVATAPAGSTAKLPDAATPCVVTPITSNFPIQKWVCIIISYDSSGYVDIYLDGKLVKSVQLPVRNILPTSATGITVGKTAGDTAVSDIYLSYFFRHQFSMDPQTAWNTYTNGAGVPGLNYLIPRYGANLTLLKDNVPANTITLF